MNFILYEYKGKSEFERVMEIVLPYGKIITKENVNKENTDFIYIPYKNKLYEFERFDENFIRAVEIAIERNPFKHCPGINYYGHLHIIELDDRFTDKKYYKISRKLDEKTGRTTKEDYDIYTSKIIDDLYDELQKLRL